MNEQFLSEQDLAARWAISSKTLTRWRGIRRGPPFVKLGKSARYAMSDILEFERNGLGGSIPKLQQPMQIEPIPEEAVRLLTIRDIAAELLAGPRNDERR